ncbi:MAG TPA: hypothetical protein PLN64_01010 [Candidatus Bipolaricaulis anaerobius]|nr:hypothetical protein [Candidatus Bipolaricaulis anaerobius]
MTGPSPYAAAIRETLEKLDLPAVPRHVEAWMRIEHPTLDGLSPADFRVEVRFAVSAARQAGYAMNERLAASFGL